MLYITEAGGQLTSSLLRPTQTFKSGTSVGDSDRCQICQQAAIGCIVVACDKCEDMMHLLCAILQTFESSLVEKFEWFSSRPPTDMEESEIRHLYPEVWAIYEADSRRLKNAPAETKFICSLCHQGELMKDARTCVLCGDSFGQNGLMIHCSEGRCVKGIHKLCLLGSESASSSQLIDSQDSSLVYKCPTCVVKTSLDSELPEDEDFLAGLFVFNIPLGIFAPPRLLAVNPDQQLLCICAALRNAQFPEHMRKRSKQWAARWFGAEMNEAEIIYKGTLRSFEGPRMGPRPNIQPFSEITPEETGHLCAPLRRKRSRNSDYTSGRVAGSSGMKFFADHGIEVIKSRIARNDDHDLSSLVCWQSHPVIRSIGELEKYIQEGSMKPASITQEEPITSQDQSSKTLAEAVRRLDEVISLEKLVAFVFPAIAREYDSIVNDVLDFGAEIRDVFAELVDQRSPAAPASIYRRKQCNQPINRSKPLNKSRIESLTSKLIAQKRAPYKLYEPLPELLFLYDQIEAFYGRDLFRILYSHPTAFNDFITACYDAASNKENTTTGTTETDMTNTPPPPSSDHLLESWHYVTPLRSFQTFLLTFTPLLQTSKLLDKSYIDEFRLSLLRMRETMIETNFVITRNNRRFTDDQIYDPLTNPNSAAAAPNNHLTSIELLIRIQKVFGRFGFMASLQFESSPGLGLYIRARGDLDEWTILGEYSGVIESRRWNTNPFLAVSDSIYDIVRSGNSNENLCIVPEPYTSIPRYINGINNHIPGELAKVNVFTKIYRLTNKYRCQHLITITEKKIRSGQQLVLNYNTGIPPELLTECGYPTSHFSIIQ